MPMSIERLVSAMRRASKTQSYSALGRRISDSKFKLIHLSTSMSDGAWRKMGSDRFWETSYQLVSLLSAMPSRLKCRLRAALTRRFRKVEYN